MQVYTCVSQSRLIPVTLAVLLLRSSFWTHLSVHITVAKMAAADKDRMAKQKADL